MQEEQFPARHVERARPSRPQRRQAAMQAPARRAHPAPARDVSDRLPHLAEYVTEDRSTYTLWDIAANDEVEVAKLRANPDPFPPEHSHPVPGALLLRLSGIALVATLLGGAPGAALGLAVALVAFARLLVFRRRARVWSRRAGGAPAPRRLPSVATAERLRLLTALGQSLLALFLGGALLALLLTALR